jgi:multiple sugar transport system ATP-binding protein
MAVVETRKLTKRFSDEVVAVNEIDLRCVDGEFLVLLGPSGCGKTTLLRMIGGLEQPTSGEILIADRVVNNLPQRARQIAMVFQSYALYPHMSVYENIAFPLKAAKLDKAAQREKIAWAASILGIDELLKRKPRQLSGGQRQRVALARALVREPNVFLLDEPLSNLDAQRRASARDELQVFQKDIGTTTIYVTHDQVEAMGMGDRIAVIDSGHIRQLGTPHEIYEEPADTFVATFVGSPPMNLVPEGDELVGFRPEAFYPITADTPSDTSSVLRVNVINAREEYLGSEKLIYAEVNGIRVVSRLPANVDAGIAEGSSATFGVLRSNLRHFNAETGLRVQPGRVPVLSGAANA